ncbi:hypothetical protein FKM82_015427 [Ascaphus truei]
MQVSPCPDGYRCSKPFMHKSNMANIGHLCTVKTIAKTSTFTKKRALPQSHSVTTMCQKGLLSRQHFSHYYYFVELRPKRASQTKDFRKHLESCD